MSLETLKKQAKAVLDWKDRPRDCIRHGVTLATMVMGHSEGPQHEKPAHGAAKPTHAVEKPEKEPKKHEKTAKPPKSAHSTRRRPL